MPYIGKKVAYSRDCSKNYLSGIAYGYFSKYSLISLVREYFTGIAILAIVNLNIYIYITYFQYNNFNTLPIVVVFK